MNREDQVASRMSDSKNGYVNFPPSRRGWFGDSPILIYETPTVKPMTIQQLEDRADNFNMDSRVEFYAFTPYGDVLSIFNPRNMEIAGGIIRINPWFIEA